ncbi:MAG: ion channel [Acidimicrobiia bacterium]
MTAAVVAAGLALVVVTLVDLVWTTVAAGSGAGPISGRLAAGLWRAALALHRRRPSHVFLSVAGVSTVFAVLALWIALVFAGWLVVFAGSDGAVRDSQTSAPADLLGRAYFVGYSVFTLGNGDFRPGAGFWQLGTVLAAGSGLVLVTLSITYLVPVASAVALRRQLASTVVALGSSPQEIVTTAWDGRAFTGLSQRLIDLGALVESSRQQHLTYPVLHYFHSRSPESAAAPNLTNLTQALHLLRHGVAPDVRPAPAVLVPLERTLDAFLSTLRRAHLDPAEPLPVPALAPLTDVGIPTVGGAVYAGADEATRRRRGLLAGFLRDDGWPTQPTRTT